MGMMARMEKADRDAKRSESEFYKDLQIFRGGESSRPTVKIWRGNQSKPIAHYYFRNEEQRERLIKTEKESADKREQYKIEKKANREAAKKAFQNPYRIGDIFHHSWGYDQTQCDFYQVVGLTKATVTLRPIVAATVEGSEGFMSRSCVALKNHFCKAFSALSEHSGEITEITKKVMAFTKQTGEIDYYIPVPYGSCSKWDGRPQYNSWYA